MTVPSRTPGSIRSTRPSSKSARVSITARWPTRTCSAWFCGTRISAFSRSGCTTRPRVSPACTHWPSSTATSASTPATPARATSESARVSRAPTIERRRSTWMLRASTCSAADSPSSARRRFSILRRSSSSATISLPRARSNSDTSPGLFVSNSRFVSSRCLASRYCVRTWAMSARCASSSDSEETFSDTSSASASESC